MPTYNNALTNQPANRLAFPSSIGPVPRNEYLGALADFLAKSYSPERTQQMQGISQLLGMPAVSRTLDMMSYGDPLTTGAGGLGGTTRVKPDVLEAAMTVAPLGKPATMATLQAARMARQAAMETGRFVAPKAGQLAEGYMQRMGMMPSIVERANPNTVWYRGQTGAKSAENPFDSTIRGTPSLADSPAVASEYAMNPNAAGNYGLLGAEDVSGAVVQPYTTSGKVFNINEYQGGHGTETGITQENLKKIAKEMGVDPSKLTDELMENFSQKWGKGKNAYWDTTERGSKSKNKIIPAWVVAENQTLIDAAKKKGIDSIQFKGALSDANAYDSLLPWNEKVTHQELRPLNREAISSTFESPRTNNLTRK